MQNHTSSPVIPKSAGWTAPLKPGRYRSAICALALATLALLSTSLWWSLVQGASAGLAFWVAQSLLMLAALQVWQRLRPKACPRSIALHQGRWQVRRPGTDGWLHPGPGDVDQPPVLLPSLVILPGGRDWVFADECQHDDWRRLNLCARFNQRRI